MTRKRGRSPWVLSRSGRDGLTWKPSQVFEKSGSRGRHLQRMSPFSFFRMRSLFSAQGLCGIDSCNPQGGHNGSDEGDN